MKPSLLILAAGLGSRYGSLKQIDQFGPSGETIIDYSIYDAIKAGFKKVVFVIRKNIESEFKDVFVDKFSEKIEIDYALQEIESVPQGVQFSKFRKKPWGTGHAVLVAANRINEPFAVVNADDFYGAHSFQLIYNYLNSQCLENLVCGLVGFKLTNTISEFGAVSRGICEYKNGRLQSIIERTKIYKKDDAIVFEDENGQICELAKGAIVSMNLMGFTPAIFAFLEQRFKVFANKNKDNLEAEFFLPNVVNDLAVAKLARVSLLPSSEKWFGVTYQQDKPVAKRKLGELITAGIYPENLWAAKS
ncbi:MAG: nucleotidyltransferase [Calditrichaeota bacterium]|nr:MAG: nucleotidyltransferase [Calditrichota bacterium]